MEDSNQTFWDGMLNEPLNFSTATSYDDASSDVLNSSFVTFRDESRFWIQRVLLPPIGTLGVFGNVVTMVVLTRRGMRSSTNNYLTALAISDLVYLLCAFWLSLKHYPTMSEPMLALYSYTLPYSLWLADASTNTSVWLTVTFTVERYIAVCYPIRGRVICTESRARRVIVAVYIICFTTTMTTPFEWTLVEAIDPVTNISRPKVVLSDLGNDETYQSVYYWFTSIIFVLLPLALLIIFNSFLIQSVRQSQNLRRTMTRQTSESEDRAAHNEIRITVTLIAVVMMFLICQLPTAATLIYKIFQASGSDADEEALLLGLGNIFNFLVTINAACNFLLYCALSDKYRRTFMLTFCRCFIRSASPTQSMAIYTQYAPTSPDASEGHSFVQNQHSPRHSTSNRGLMPSRNVDNHRQSSVRTNSTYLALPGNGSVYRQGGQMRNTRNDQRANSLQTDDRSANIHCKRKTSEATDRYSLQQNRSTSRCWPWSSSKKSAKLAKSNILIEISDAEHQTPHRQTHQVDDVASV